MYVLNTRRAPKLCFFFLFSLMKWKLTWTILKGRLGVKKLNQHKVHEKLTSFGMRRGILDLQNLVSEYLIISLLSSSLSLSLSLSLFLSHFMSFCPNPISENS